LEGALDGVDGFLFLDEARALHEVVLGLPENPLVVEIGSWKGRSAIAMGLALKVRGSGRLCAVDPHQEDTLDAFRANLKRAGVVDVVELVIDRAHSARSKFADCSVDFIFIDGSHDYADVRVDVQDWPGALKDVAAIALNDPWSPGVYRAMKESVLRPGPYRRPRLVDNTVFFDFRRQEPWTERDGRLLQRLKVVLWLKFQARPLWRFIPSVLVRAARSASMRLLTS
jgi:hypothetical protein